MLLVETGEPGCVLCSEAKEIRPPAHCLRARRKGQQRGQGSWQDVQNQNTHLHVCFFMPGPKVWTWVSFTRICQSVWLRFSMKSYFFLGVFSTSQGGLM